MLSKVFKSGNEWTIVGPTEGCASNLVLWMMEKKQACPDSVSLLSSSAAQ